MESSHSSLPVYDPDIRHTFIHLQSLPENHKHARTLEQQHQNQHQQPPSKRRRAKSQTAEPTTFSPSAYKQSPYTKSLIYTERISDPPVPRANSPDRTSRVSTASSVSLSGPQLRKKPKSSSIKNTNLLRAASAAILKSPSLPAFHSSTHPEHDIAATASNVNGNSGPSISRANSGTSQHQSPNQKRPPASHSSYGVETTCGPPASYSTQRTLSQERIRKLDRNTQIRMQASQSESVQTPVLDEIYDTSTHGKESEPLSIQSSPDTADTQSIPTPTEAENLASIKIRGEKRKSMEDETKASSSDERRSEDLFLNIARVDAARPSHSKGEKRRSRISIPFLTSNRPAQVVRSSPTRPQFDSSAVVSPRPEAQQLHNKRTSIGGHVPGASSSRSHLIDSGRLREQSTDFISDNEKSESAGFGIGVCRSSTANPESTRLAHRSSAGLRSHRLGSESIQVDRPRTGEQIATESTISTTAPSTVWDELDDLKSRIHKLELTGKLPSSSAAAMASSERPRTATTAATTMSTSPKYKSSEPNLPSTVQGVNMNLHPLLHDAMDHARAVVSRDVYEKLEATAQDALQLAAMMSSDGVGGRSYATSWTNERQIRRRTESMCRGLTELAIALAAEAKPAHPVPRPTSRDQNLPPNSMLRTRRYSNDPADRGQAPTRVQSRLDSRRISLHLGRGGAGYSSPERGSYVSPASAAQPIDPRINRSSTLLRKRGQGSFDGTDEQYDASPSVRPASRAMTELGAYRRISRDQMLSSREYTSQHPLPTPQEQAAAVAASNNPLPTSSSVNFTSRRKYASPSSAVGTHDSSPVTPREAWGRISLVSMATQSPDVVSEAGGLGRQGSSRRSLGFASRIGSSVGSRLRAARTERSSGENMGGRGDRDVVRSMYGDHTTTAADVDIRQAEDA